MSLTDELNQLDADLHHHKSATRREAVQRAAAMLKQRACLEPCRQRIVALLRERAEQDMAYTVKEAAQTVLDNLDHGYDPTWLPDDRKHMIGVRCSAGHVTYFDKRILCAEYRSVTRGMTHEVYKPCGEKGCPHKVKVSVDCEGYV